MTITNGYCELNTLKSALSIGTADTTSDSDLEQSVEAASRGIDGHCGKGRKFWLDSGTVVRQYYPSESQRCWVDDIGTTASLAIAVDYDDDGTYETVLAANTDYILEPVNAATDSKPYESIRLVNGNTFVRSAYGRPTVQVTARFGYGTPIPEPVERACVTIARDIYKMPTAWQMSVDGIPVPSRAMSAQVRVALEPFIRYSGVDDDADC